MTSTLTLQHKYFHSMLNDEEQMLLKYLPTVPVLLDFTLEHYAELPAISDGGKAITYKELYERVAVRRGRLKALGFKPGDIIAVLSPNSVDAMELYLAIVSYGAVSLMLPAQLSGMQLYSMCKKFDVKGVFCDMGHADITGSAGVPAYDMKYTLTPPEEAALVSKDSLCSICLTGGTTGLPKGAMLSHGAIMRGAFNGCLYEGGVLRQTSISILPLSHIFGLVMGFLSFLYKGCLVYDCPDVKQVFTKIPLLRPTNLILVPGMAEIIAKLGSVKGQDYYGSIQTIVIGAAPVPPRLLAELESMGIRVFAGYGLTEGANLSAGNKDVSSHPESMGMLYPEQEHKLVDGELRLRGDNLMLGYYGDGQATADAFDEDGFLRTGDLARFDEQGRIYITGRIKNLIILSNGENVSPEELEELFYKDARVRDCLVKEHWQDGRQMIAIELLPEPEAVRGMSMQAQEELFGSLLREINAQLPSYKRIGRLIIRSEDFKRSPSMKIVRGIA